MVKGLSLTRSHLSKTVTVFEGNQERGEDERRAARLRMMCRFRLTKPAVGARVVDANLRGVLQLLLNRTEIHGGFNDFLVGRELFGVHWQEERPGLILLLQLFEEYLTWCQLSLLLLRERPIVTLLPW